MMKEIMPIGSVVRIKAHQYLVAGYTSETKNGTNKLSYILFPWPAGYLSKKKTFLCRTDQIDEVLYKGYQDDKGQILLAKLNNYQKVDNQNNKVADIVHKEDDYRQKDGLKTAGTIVRLKDNPVLYMIAGYYPKGKKAIKDYFGVVYPFGYRKEKYNSGFDESDIEEVIFNGYQDKAALSFLVDLPEYMQMATDVFIEATEHIKNTNDENTINNEQNVSINLQME